MAYGRWEDGSCPAADPASDPGENGAPSEHPPGSPFGAQLGGHVRSRKPEDRQFWRQGAKPREVARAC